MSFSSEGPFTTNNFLSSHCNGVFTLLDTVTCANTNTDRVRLYSCVETSIQWNDTGSCTDTDADGYCTQFGTYIGTDKVKFRLIFTSVSPSVSV